MTRRLWLALLLVALSAAAIPPGVVGTTPGRPKFGVSDNFNRADGGLGANWATTGLTISGNRAGRIGVGGGAPVWAGGSFSNNQYSEVSVQNVKNPNSYAGAVVRTSGTNGANGYGIVQATNGNWSIVRITNQSFTHLIGCALPTTGNVIVRIEAVGTLISVYELSAHGGTKTFRGSATDATYTSGRPGIYASGQFGNGYVDDWYGGDL